MLGKTIDFDDERKSALLSYSKILSWYGVAPKIWCVLGLGWLWVILSFTFKFEEPSSGAILVCAAVFAEVFYERSVFRNWRRMNYGEYFGFALTEDAAGRLGLGDGNLMICGKVGGFGGPVRALLGLSRESDWSKSCTYQGQHTDGTFWIYSYTIARVEKAFTTFILTTAVIGTVIWGYAHCLDQACKIG